MIYVVIKFEDVGPGPRENHGPIKAFYNKEQAYLYAKENETEYFKYSIEHIELL